MTQLRSFAFVRVDPSVKKAMKEQEKEEAKHKSSEDGSEEQRNLSHRPSMVSRPSSSGDTHRRRNGNGKFASEDENSASLILHPNRASPLESKYLQHITETLLTTNYSALDLSDGDKT